MTEDVVKWINGLTATEARDQLLRCCGSTWWCDQMAAARPFRGPDDIASRADAIFDRMPDAAWLEAFARHPRIGDLDSLRMRFGGAKEWSATEQAGVARAGEKTLERLAAGNDAYADRFGYTFIVCATGKSAAEMLAALEARLANEPDTELPLAAAEQRKITHIRLAKLRPDGAT